MSTTPRTVEELREFLSPERHEERLRKLSPERRALYDRIRKLREEIGPIEFDVAKALREIRSNDD